MSRLLNGTTDNIQVASSTSLNITTAISLVAWIKFSSAPGNTSVNTIFVKAAAATWVSPFADWALRIGTGSSLFLQGCINDFGNAADVVASTGTITDTNWHHVALTYDGAVIRAYIDGSADGTTVVSLAINTSGRTLFIGEHTAGGENFPGNLADLAVYNVALTAAEISALSKGARPWMVRPSARAMDLPLDGLVSPEPDQSGNRNNGVVTGASRANNAPVTLWTPKRITAPLIGVATGVKNLPPFQRMAA